MNIIRKKAIMINSFYSLNRRGILLSSGKRKSLSKNLKKTMPVIRKGVELVPGTQAFFQQLLILSYYGLKIKQ